jgi:hypothetical protein
VCVFALELMCARVCVRAACVHRLSSLNK